MFDEPFTTPRLSITFTANGKHQNCTHDHGFAALFHPLDVNNVMFSFLKTY